jgi:hypothetical protein
MDGYPKTKYPQNSGGSITVTSPEQEKALGPGWVDHPPPESVTFAEFEKPLIEAQADLKEATGKFEKPRRKKEQPSSV